MEAASLQEEEAVEPFLVEVALAVVEELPVVEGEPWLEVEPWVEELLLGDQAEDQGAVLTSWQKLFCLLLFLCLPPQGSVSLHPLCSPCSCPFSTSFPSYLT